MTAHPSTSSGRTESDDRTVHGELVEPCLCKVARLSDINVQIFANPDLSGWAMPMLEHSLYQYATVSGEVSQPEADTWLSDIKARAQSGDYFFCLPQFVVSARKQ